MLRAVTVVLIALLAVACTSGTENRYIIEIPTPSFRTDFSEPEGDAVTLPDYYRIRRVGSARLSPDGSRVSYMVSAPVEEDNSTHAETWVVKVAGDSEPRHIRHNGADVSSAGWTDAGLLRYRAGMATWALDLDSGNARPQRLEDPVTGTLSPDGRWRARLEEISLPEADPEPRSEFERRHEERFEGAQFDWMNFQRDGAPIPVPDPRKRPAQAIVLNPGQEGEDASEPRRLLEDLALRPSGLVWHPDGERMAFVADEHFRDESTYGRSDLWMARVDGEVERLTDDGFTYSSLGFSPDGRLMSYVRGSGTDMVIEGRLDNGGPRDLYVRPMDGGAPVNLTASWDFEPRGPRWSPDGAHIYFTAGLGGTSHLFRVAVDGGAISRVTTGERRLGGISFDGDMTRMAYTVGRFEDPGEVWVAEIDGSNERQITHVHDEVRKEIAFSEAERLIFASTDGTPIEGWLLYPYGYRPDGGPYPLIVHSHGGPHSAAGYGFNFKHQLFAAHGYFVLTTNFRSSTGYGEAFKWATWGAWGDRDGADVVSGIDFVIEHFPVDADRVGTIGHSYGGFMSNWLIVQYPDRFRAAIVGAGISNWISDYGTADIARTKETEFYGPPWNDGARQRLTRQSPLIYADRALAATLFVHGEVDQRVPYEEAEQMYFALKKNGVPAKMLVYEGQSHGIRGHWNGVHRAMSELRWWEIWLKPDQPPEPLRRLIENR
jgi:dipeptidyl aminopeptidase/acylaminoacyl peptidase